MEGLEKTVDSVGKSAFKSVKWSVDTKVSLLWDTKFYIRVYGGRGGGGGHKLAPRLRNGCKFS